VTSKVYVVTDLGFGDGGKGSVVHAIANRQRAHTVIKRGGAQGSHGVQTSRGAKFDFSQWGCGTLEGIPTHLSGQMILMPEALLTEAKWLQYEQGMGDPFALLTVDATALCATPYHGIVSRLKELARRDNPRGTVGTGVGEAYRMFQKRPDLAILARDLSSPDLKDKLVAQLEYIRSELQPIIHGEFLAADMEDWVKETTLLSDYGFLDFVLARFKQAARKIRIVGSDYLGQEILARDGVAVVETSHGVLTDRVAGFHPHTSAIRTLPQFTDKMLANAGFGGEVVHLGVTRAYAVKHGAGPLPTSDPGMAARLFPDIHKEDNRYQGNLRAGPLDFVTLRHAIEACGGADAFNGLAVTCMDQVKADGVWAICSGYEREPQITRIKLDSIDSNDSLYDVCAQVVQKETDIPVRMMSFGPTPEDKLYR
jgi:adenylosuccinate synthase